MCFATHGFRAIPRPTCAQARSGLHGHEAAVVRQAVSRTRSKNHEYFFGLCGGGKVGAGGFARSRSGSGVHRGVDGTAGDRRRGVRADSGTESEATSWGREAHPGGDGYAVRPDETERQLWTGRLSSLFVSHNALRSDNVFQATSALAKCPSKYEMHQKRQRGEGMPHGPLAAGSDLGKRTALKRGSRDGQRASSHETKAQGCWSLSLSSLCYRRIGTAMRFLRNLFLGLASVGVLVAVPVLAQQAAGDYPAACEEAKVSRGDHERAHTVFLSGKQFLEESNYDKAISYFKDAYSIDCSVHAMLPIIATAYERKGDMAEAIRALGEYLVRASGAPDREVIEHRIRNLKDRLAHEQPPAPGPTAVSTTEPTSSAAPTPAPLPVASPGASPPIAPVPSPAEPTQSSGASPAPWIVASLGAAAVIGGVVALVVGAGDVSNAEAACGANRQCPNTPAGNAAVAKGNDGRSLETAGGVVGGVGLALVAGGLIWHFTQGPATPAAATFTPMVAPGYAGVGIGGAF